MLKTFFLCNLLFIYLLVSGQERLAITALNRFCISKSDTILEFYARMPVKKDKIKKGKLYYWYSGDSIMATTEGFSGRLLDGRYTVYYPNKSLKEQGTFKHGLKDGNWRYWKDNGNLVGVEKWRMGEQMVKKIKVKKKKTARKKKAKTLKAKQIETHQ